jgi:hypothetical protein
VLLGFGVPEEEVGKWGTKWWRGREEEEEGAEARFSGVSSGGSVGLAVPRI